MVKQSGLILMVVCSALLLNSCQKSPDQNKHQTGTKKQVLSVFNWTYYMPDDVRADFEKEFNCQIVYGMYASNEEMFTKLKAGGSGYDVVFPSGDYVSIMIHEGMLDTIDQQKVPNFKLIDSMVIAKIDFDSGNVFSVPYMMGASGIAVNKKYVKEYPRSYSIFDRADLKGRMTMLDDMREVFAAALALKGHSVNTHDLKQLDDAKSTVLGWKKNLQKFDAETFAKGFSAGEFWVVQCYAENIFREYDSTRRDEIDFFIPQEGGGMYIDNMCILKTAKNKELAHAFVNYLQRPDIQARICVFLMLPSTNVHARGLMNTKPNYQMEEMRNGQLKDNLGPMLKVYDSIWQEIRIGS